MNNIQLYKIMQYESQGSPIIAKIFAWFHDIHYVSFSFSSRMG